uniref:Uncharacterized protein n=1 Tax=Arundo donax TaxID=35708 RepID=A0A0A9CKB1_ARUDO
MVSFVTVAIDFLIILLLLNLVFFGLFEWITEVRFGEITLNLFFSKDYG